MKYGTTLIVAILFASVYGRSVTPESLSSRIVNGEKAPDGAFPYMASLRSYNYHSCGGAVLNDRWILTAAHCGSNGLTAYVGTNDLRTGGEAYPVEKVFINPNYANGPTYASDIALLKVSKSINFNKLVKSISLPSSALKDNQKAVLSGWGYTVPGGWTPDNLQYFNVTSLTSRTCEKRIPISLHQSQICAYGKKTQGACHGDSGSPLVSNGVVIGVTSRLVEVPCAHGYPDIYTDVHLFLDWINKTIKEN